MQCKNREIWGHAAVRSKALGVRPK